MKEERLNDQENSVFQVIYKDLCTIDLIDKLTEKISPLIDYVSKYFVSVNCENVDIGEFVVFDEVTEDDYNFLKPGQYFYGYRIQEAADKIHVVLASLIIKFSEKDYLSYNFYLDLNKGEWIIHEAQFENRSVIYGLKHLKFDKEVIFNNELTPAFVDKLTAKVEEIRNCNDSYAYWKNSCMSRTDFQRKYPGTAISTLTLEELYHVV